MGSSNSAKSKLKRRMLVKLLVVAPVFVEQTINWVGKSCGDPGVQDCFLAEANNSVGEPDVTGYGDAWAGVSPRDTSITDRVPLADVN